MTTDTNDIKTSLIVAMAENLCIGQNNQMPWHIPEDLKRFKALTMGHPVIMGRKTFESILGYLKKPLPGRDSIIVSRKSRTLYPDAGDNVHQAYSIENAIEMAREITTKQGLKEIFIIGGGQVFKHSLPLADKIYLTKVHREIGGDAFFPKIDEAIWEETESEDHEEHDPPFSFVTLERKQQKLL